MVRGKRLAKTLATLLIGVLIGMAAQMLGARWSQKAEAASIDSLARSAIAQIVQAIPLPNGDKIKGVAGIGDGKTFVVWTNDQIYFYQMSLPSR